MSFLKSFILTPGYEHDKQNFASLPINVLQSNVGRRLPTVV